MTPPFYTRKQLRTSQEFSKSGIFFVTINCKNLEFRFGHISKKKMRLNEVGLIAQQEWLNLEIRFMDIRLHRFQIMPNHIHSIIEIMDVIGHTGHYLILSDVICAYKSIVANNCLKMHKKYYAHSPVVPPLGKIWQRSFHACTIKDSASYKAIDRYIQNNPGKWNSQ